MRKLIKNTVAELSKEEEQTYIEYGIQVTRKMQDSNLFYVLTGTLDQFQLAIAKLERPDTYLKRIQKALEILMYSKTIDEDNADIKDMKYFLQGFRDNEL